MSAAHTPGPWTVAGQTVWADFPHDDPNSGLHCAAREIARAARDGPTDHANARLIAAAPQLAEALRVLVQTCETAQAGAFCNGVTADNGVDEGEVRTREWINRARAALTAAGVTP